MDTVRRFKGLEAPVVILWGLGGPYCVPAFPHGFRPRLVRGNETLMEIWNR